MLACSPLLSRWATGLLRQSSEQFLECNRGNACPDIGKSVGQDDVAGMDHAAAGVHDIGYVSFALLGHGNEERLFQVADDATRIVEIEQHGAECVTSECTDPVGDHEPPGLGLQR